MPPVAFQAFGTSHLAVLGITVAMAASLVAARQAGKSWVRPLELILAWAVAASHFLALYFWRQDGLPLTIDIVLPMHLCNWAGFAVCIALVWKKPLAAELAWFWAMAGTLQGMLTPNQAFDWPHPSFFTFFLLHSGVMIGAFQAVFGLGLKPRPGAWLRGILWTEAYVISAGSVNLLTNSNYAFLCAKPDKASLMDHLGPWPWYLLSFQVLGAAIIILLYLPFRRSASASTHNPADGRRLK